MAGAEVSDDELTVLGVALGASRHHEGRQVRIGRGFLGSRGQPSGSTQVTPTASAEGGVAGRTGFSPVPEESSEGPLEPVGSRRLLAVNEASASRG